MPPNSCRSRLLGRVRSAEFNPPLEVRTQVWYNPDLISAHFMIPGVIGMILFAITSILTATTIVRERERGTIEQLIVTPIRSWELLVGKVNSLCHPIAVRYTGRVGNRALVVQGASARRSWSHHRHLGIIVAFRPGHRLICFYHCQYAAGSLYDSRLDDPSCRQYSLSGFLFPIEAMPTVLRWISYLIPLRYYLTSFARLLLKGVGAAALQNEIIALAIFGVGIMGRRPCASAKGLINTSLSGGSSKAKPVSDPKSKRKC